MACQKNLFCAYYIHYGLLKWWNVGTMPYLMDNTLDILKVKQNPFLKRDWETVLDKNESYLLCLVSWLFPLLKSRSMLALGTLLFACGQLDKL
jgi:hypothetical protein